MKRAIYERPTTPPRSHDWSGNHQPDSTGLQDHTLEVGTGIGLQPAQQAVGEQGAPLVLPPMVFPGPLAYEPLPAIPPGENAPAPLPNSGARGVPSDASNGSGKAASSGPDPDGAALQAARIPAPAAALMQADSDRVRKLISESGTTATAATATTTTTTTTTDKAHVPDDPPLVSAARLGQLGVVNCLLDAGAQVNLADAKTGKTALMTAAGKGHVEIVQRLLKQAGIECDKLNANGNSALLLAAVNNHPSIVDCLLDAGAQVNLADAKTEATALLVAADRGHVEIVQRLLKQPGIECDKLDANGDSALILATRNNHPSVVDCLLDAGAQVNLADAIGATALLVAAENGYVEIVQRLLKQPGIDCDKLNADGDSVLILAAAYSCPSDVDCLLDAGAQVNLANTKTGETALMAAAYAGDVEIVQRLLKQPRIECDKLDVDGNSALILTARNNCLSVVNCLLDAGAQVNLGNAETGATALMAASGKGHVEIVQRLLKQRGIAHGKLDADGDSALILAAKDDHLSVVDCLLDAGAQVNLANAETGETALMAAARKGHVAIVQRLLKQRGIAYDKLSANGNSALILAARNNLPSVVNCLLDAGAQVNLANARTGETALMAAAYNGHVEIVQRLLKQPGIDCDKVDADGDSALILATRNNRPSVVDCLLDAGAQVNLADAKTGTTALMFAVYDGHVEIAQRLLKQSGIDCDKLDADGDSALILAAKDNHPSVVDCLLDAGAQVNLADAETGETALMAAAGKGHVEIVQRLLKQPGTACDKLNAKGNSALLIAIKKTHPSVVNALLVAGAHVNFDEALTQALSTNSAAIVEVLFRHGGQLLPISELLTNEPDWFVVTVEDLAADCNTPAPALPGRHQARAFFDQLIELLANGKYTDKGLLQWLKGKGLRSAVARELLVLLNGALAPWKADSASVQQKMVYCLGAFSHLRGLGAAGKVLKLYQDAGISAAATERLGAVVSSQLDDMANLAAGMLAGTGSDMMESLIDNCLARTNTDVEVNVAEFTESLIGQGYCSPVAQAMVRSWQAAMLALGTLPTPPIASATIKQQMVVLKAHMARHAPSLFAQALLRDLASHEPVRQLSAMQDSKHDEVLHALFQVQCNQLRQFCEHLLAPPPSGTTGANDGADATQTAKLI